MQNEIVTKVNGIRLYDTAVSEVEISYYFNSSKKKIYLPTYVGEYVNNLDRKVIDDADEQARNCAIQLHNMCEAEYDAFTKGVLNHLLKVIGETLLM